MRYLLLILFFFSNSVFAEQYELEKGILINLPKNYAVTKEEVGVTVERALKSGRFTEEEKEMRRIAHLQNGESVDDIMYSIDSKKRIEFYEKDLDPWGKAENDIILSDLINECMSLYKVKKKIKKCAYDKTDQLLEFDGIDTFIILFKNEDPELNRLNNISDDVLSELSKKEIAQIRKKYASNINWRSKNKYFKEIGIRNIKITGMGNFYVETITSQKIGNYKSTNIRFILPYKNRRFIINANCQTSDCNNAKEKMAKIIEPIFKINTKGIKVYDFQKKQDMIELLEKVKNGYRAFKFAKLIFLIV